jgi:hypothetical protein
MGKCLFGLLKKLIPQSLNQKIHPHIEKGNADIPTIKANPFNPY